MSQVLPATQVDGRPSVPRDQTDGGSVSMGPSHPPGTRRASHSMTDESAVAPSLPVAQVSHTRQASATSTTPAHSELGLSVGLSSTVSPQGTHAPLALKTITQTDIAVFSKESMQSAAERARERRRLEEEEREKEKERARKKAESLAALMGGASHCQSANPKTAPVSASQESITSPLSVSKQTAPPASRSSAITTSNDGPVWRTRSRACSQRDRSSFVFQPSSRPLPSSKEDEVPILLYSSDKLRTSRSPASGVGVPSSGAPPPSAPVFETASTENNRDVWRSKPDAVLEPKPISFDVPDISEAPRVVGDEHLETIDCSDLSKPVDYGEDVMIAPPVSIPSPTTVTQTNFAIPRSELSTTHITEQKPHDFTQSVLDSLADASSSGTPRSPRVHLRNVSDVPQDISQPQPSSHSHPPASHTPLRHLGPQPPGIKHQFKEAPMAALDDVMSRIKGALITMHPGEMARNSVYNLDDEAYRASRLAEIHAAHPHTSAERENFLQSQIPRPPTPQHTKPRVRLKLHRRPQQPISTRLLHMWKLPPKPVRWDILSWDPPVADMSRRSLLPLGSTTFKPTKSLNVLQSIVKPVNPISRSPPPTSPARNACLSLPKTDRVLSAFDDSLQPGASKAKNIHKLPIGTDVAFYKSPSSSTASASSSNVRFLVSSEVDETITSPLLGGSFATTMHAADDGRDDKVCYPYVYVSFHEPSIPFSH